MESEKKYTSMIIVIVILSIFVVGLGTYVVYDKFLSNKDSKDSYQEEIDNDDVNQNNLNENLTIDLSKEEKTKINETLNSKAIPFTSVNSLEYNDSDPLENIFDDDEERFNFAFWYIVYNEYDKATNDTENIKLKCSNNDQIMGCIKLSYIHEKSNEFFGLDFDDDDIKQTITSNNYIYVPVVEGGSMGVTLKVKDLSLNEKTNEYSLTIDYIKTSNPDDAILKNEITEYDESLIEKSAIIKYREKDNKKVLLSWTYII